MALSEDNGLNSAIGAARSLMHFGKVNTFEFIAEQINKLTNKDVQRVANDYLNKNDAFTLIYTKA